jgi:hypothetical protein
MSGGTVVVPCAGAGLFIFWSVPEISWQNPPLQSYVYKTDASGHDMITQVATYNFKHPDPPLPPLKKGGFEDFPPFVGAVRHTETAPARGGYHLTHW